MNEAALGIDLARWISIAYRMIEPNRIPKKNKFAKSLVWK
jgi:hypothetical protein